MFLYDFRAASPKENVESGSLSQIKPVKFIATHKFIEPCSIQRMQSDSKPVFEKIVPALKTVFNI